MQRQTHDQPLQSSSRDVPLLRLEAEQGALLEEQEQHKRRGQKEPPLRKKPPLVMQEALADPRSPRVVLEHPEWQRAAASPSLGLQNDKQPSEL